MGGILSGTSRCHPAKRKQDPATACRICKIGSRVSEEDVFKRLQQVYLWTLKNDCWKHTTLKTLVVRHPLHLFEMIRNCKKEFLLPWWNASADCTHISLDKYFSPGVANQTQPAYAGQTKKRYRLLVTLTILLASALACQLASLPRRRLSQSCEGLLMAGALEGESESLEYMHDHWLGAGRLRRRRKHLNIQSGNPGGLSQAHTAGVVSGEMQRPSDLDMMRPSTTAERGAGRTLTSAASKELPATHKNDKRPDGGKSGPLPCDFVLTELDYWEHLTGEARPALAVLLEGSLTEGICPAAQIFNSTARRIGRTCLAHRPKVATDTGLSADSTLPQAWMNNSTAESSTSGQIVEKQSRNYAEISEGKGIQLLQKHGEGRKGTSDSLKGTALGARSRAKRETINFGILETASSQLPPTQSSLSSLTNCTTGRACFSSNRKHNNVRSSLTKHGDKRNRYSGKTATNASRPSGAAVKAKHIHDKQRTSATARHSDGFVVFHAPHFTTKITRYADKPVREVRPHKTTLEVDGRGSLLEEYMDSECAEADAARGGERTYMRVLGENSYSCFEESELDFSRHVAACLDSCGAPIKCRGAINVHYDDHWGTRRLDIDINSVTLKGLYCVNSRLQARLNELCGRAGQVWRVRDNIDSCVYAAQIDWHEAGAACVDDCGSPARCYGIPRSPAVVPVEERNRLLKRKQDEIRKFCMCNEKMGPGVLYEGCQTVTRSGRTCQKWNSMEPHAHVELTQEDHNFCRNPYNESSIWCYTTDPQVRLDYCNPLGPKNQYIQPQEKLNVVIVGRNLNPSVALRIYNRAPDEPAVCGPHRKKQRSSFFSFLSPAPGDRNLPIATAEDGAVSALTWEGVYAAHHAAGGVTFCGCNYWYIEANEQNEAPCSHDADYTELLGSVHVAGPKYPANTEMWLSTTAELEIALEGVELSVGDILTVISGTNPEDCARRNEFTVQLGALRGSPQALETDTTVVVRTTLVEANRSGGQAKSAPLRVPTIGKYLLCWNGAKHDFASTAVANILVLTGFNTNQNFVLVRSPLHGYSMVQQSTLYISTYESHDKIDADAIRIQAASIPPCQGAEIGCSTNIKRLSTLDLSNTEKTLYKASVLTKIPRDADSDEVNVLDVCVKLDHTTVHLGRGTIGTTYLYNFSDFATPATLHPAAPDGVFTYKIDADSPLGAHWVGADGQEGNILPMFTPLFRGGSFPKALSFWVNRVQGYITAWVFDPAAPAPDLALIWELPNAVTVALDACITHVHLYVVTGQPPQLHVFDVSNPAGGRLDRPVAVLDGRAQKFVDLCSVVLIYSTSASGCKPLILLLDKGSGFLWLYNTDLTPILSTRQLDGMSAPMSKPSSLSCTPTPSKSRQILDTWDCVIADAGTSALVYFRVYPDPKKIVFVQEYYGESFIEGRNTDLKSPHVAVAHRFTDKTLIYAAEVGSPDMHLLVVDPTEDVVRFEAFVSPADNIPSIRNMFIVPIQLYPEDPDDVLLATFREGITGPQLQYGPLSTTGRIPEFLYQPREWYGVGDVDVLKPLARGGGSLEKIHEYAFDESARDSSYISDIADINRKTGVIHLFISRIQKHMVSIKVFGIGLVNKQVTEFAIRVACRDGYYANDRICVKCEAGTYNSVQRVAENPQVAWSACRHCPPAYSTVAEGSVSANQCQCQKGYHMEENSGSAYCVPCPPGTWKDTVSNTGCQGKCPAHSSTQVVGATTPEERQCECEPGYYYNAGNNESCVKAPAGFFSPGGYRAQLITCPPGTTTESDTSGEAMATSLRSCICEKGYTPASVDALADPTSAASLLRDYLKSSPEYADLQDSQVCVKCERGRYKDVVGNQECKSCPKHSYAFEPGATSLESCTQCAPGFYQTGELSKPCRKCPRDHFCVGSEPTNPAFTPYANKIKPCPPFSKTVSFAANDHPLKCMCRVGYEFRGMWADLTVTCLKTRLNFYKEITSNKPGTPCPSNTVTEVTAATSPMECSCPPGRYFAKETNECKGFYCLGKRDPGDHSDVQPTKCPPWTSTHDVGAKSYSECFCDKGYQRKTLQTGAVKNVQCSPCPQNRYKDWVGDAPCRACGDNSGTRLEGATSVAQCLCFKGYYYNYTLFQCTACGGGSNKYCPGGDEDCNSDDPHCVDGKKPAEPKPCPENTRVPAGFDAASSVDDCKCEPGFAYRSGDSSSGTSSCVPCAPGSYKPSIQNSACNSMCGASATSFPGARSQSQCFCEEGTFRVGETCHPCPIGAVCNGGLLPEAQLKIENDPHFTRITPAHHVKPYAKPGYFLSKLREELHSVSDWRFTPCPIKNACLEKGICVETMTEYLCSECRPNFTSNFAKGEMCTACPSMGWNISLITLYYLGILLFNIVMTYMNVAAGFNRRSIHSIVIKIASNFLTCMSVVGALDFNTITLPDWAARLTTRVTEQVTVKQRVQWLSVDCLLRQGFRLSYSDSFYYTMLFYALLPIALPIIATAIMYVLLRRMQAWYRISTKRKLDLIKQAEECGLSGLSEQLRERCAQDRVFLIFRYIPLPGESRLTRFAKFMEDMIPIYVTVLFFLHSPTTTQMLSLLECTYMDFGRGHKAKYVLRAAMSVECELGIGKPYFKYLALGVVGLCTWSIGIPLSGFMVLYMNRKNLYSRATRLKYGFLHNGFLKKYWYWETVAFARKLLVLMSSSVVFIHSRNASDSRIWTAMLISIVFLMFHLIAQPFDKRSYLTLDRLETHSMSIWTFTCVIMAMILGSDFGGNTNMTLLSFLVLLVTLFLLEVAFSLMIAYFDNVRAQKTFFTVPVVGRLFRFFGRMSEKRRAHEPVVIYDVENEVFQLVAAKRHGWKIFKKKADKIYLAERDYFIKVLAETLWFAVAHMKLNVIPGAFLEFILLLGMSIHKKGENSQENQKSLQAIADGDLSRLTEWSRNEHAKKEDAKKVQQQKRDIKRRIANFYKRFDMGLHRRRRPRFHEHPDMDNEGVAERVRDLEGTAPEDEMSSDGSGQNTVKEAPDHDSEDDVECTSISSGLPSVVDSSVGDLENDALWFIDKEQLTTGIVLSELYLALLKLQQKDSSGIGNQYEVFRNQKLATAATYAEQLLEKNRKLKLIRLAFQSLVTSSPRELHTLGVNEQNFNNKKKELAELNVQISSLNDRLRKLIADPGELDADLEEEWVNKGDFDDLVEHQNAASQEFELAGGDAEEDHREDAAEAHHQEAYHE